MFSVFFCHLFVSFADYSFCLSPLPWLAWALKIQNSAFHISPSVFTTRRHIPRALLDDLLTQVIQKKPWSSLDLQNCDPFCNYWLIISSYDPDIQKVPSQKPSSIVSQPCSPSQYPTPETSLLYGKITSQPLTMTSLHLLLCYSKHMWLLHNSICHFRYIAHIQELMPHCYFYLKSIIEFITSYPGHESSTSIKPMLGSHLTWLADWHFQTQVLSHAFFPT